MRSTTAPAVPPPAEQEVFGLDAPATMTYLVERRRRQNLAAAEEMRAVTHWADLHAVSDLLDGAIDPEVYRTLAEDEGAEGREQELRLAGEGAFKVREFAVCEIAAALELSEPGARSYVGQSLELRDRLPRLWSKVMAGVLPAWKARLVAKETIPLNPAAAAYVDAQLAPFAAKISPWRILKAVEAATLRHDPELAARRAAAAAEKRGVWVEDRLDGTTEINAITNTPDAVAFDTALDRVATSLGSLGDVDPRQARRAKAVGVLADPQYALDLASTAAAAGEPAAAADEAAADPSNDAVVGHRPTKSDPTIHVHLHTDAVTGLLGADGAGQVARVDGFGPRAIEALQQWLAGLTAGSTVKVTPVVDLNDYVSVDAYEAPDRLRNQIDERDGCCTFPWCGRQGRYDLDHIEEFIPAAEGGPPGQTNTENFARLCRFHHRVKTHSDWSYRRYPDGTLRWTSPLGRGYTVDRNGTSALN